MSRFSGLLKHSVPHAEQTLERFYEELRGLVNDVNRAIEEEQEGLAELKLESMTEQLQGGIFRLAIEDRQGRGMRRVIIDFLTGAEGYPIKMVVPGSTRVLDKAEDSSELEAYFGSMLRAADSPIVTFLAFLRRNRRGATSG